MRLSSLYGLAVVLPFLCAAQGAAGAAGAVPSASLPPHPKSVTDFFRQLLAAPPGEQAQLLASKPASTRAVLQRKLEEYRALPAEECELRLRALDLRWYLTSLMRVPATNRSVRLAAIPEKDRQMVIDRLRHWDRLPPDLQKEVLESENVIALLVGGGLPGKSILPPMPRQNENEAAMARWQKIPAERRREIVAHVRGLFGPSAAQPPPISSVTNDRQLDPILEKIKLLPETERNVCLSNFQKFAALSRTERERFLRSAIRWQQLPPEERQLARRLPPLPPGLDFLSKPPTPSGFSLVPGDRP